jgi:hypothetical protein
MTTTATRPASPAVNVALFRPAGCSQCAQHIWDTTFDRLSRRKQRGLQTTILNGRQLFRATMSVTESDRGESTYGETEKTTRTIHKVSALDAAGDPAIFESRNPQGQVVGPDGKVKKGETIHCQRVALETREGFEEPIVVAYCDCPAFEQYGWCLHAECDCLLAEHHMRPLLATPEPIVVPAIIVAPESVPVRRYTEAESAANFRNDWGA